MGCLLASTATTATDRRHVSSATYALSQATDTTDRQEPAAATMPPPPPPARAALAAGGSRRRWFGGVAMMGALLGLLLVLQVLPPGVTAAAPLKGTQAYAICTHIILVSILHRTHHHRPQSRLWTRRSWTSLRPQDSRRRSTRRRVCAFVCGDGTRACMYMYESSSPRPIR